MHLVAVSTGSEEFWIMSLCPLFEVHPSSFQGIFAPTLRPTHLSVQELGHPTHKREHATQRGSATQHGQGPKWAITTH